MAVSAASTDGAAHSVQVYSDISAEWVSGDNSLTANWTTTTSNGTITHQVQLARQAPFSEINDHTQCEIHLYFMYDVLTLCPSDGSAFYSLSNVSNEMKAKVTKY